MKQQITQNELLRQLDNERDCIRWDFERTRPDNESKRERQIAKMDTYDNLINKLCTVEIVPEHHDTQRNDRIREFGYGWYDATTIDFIDRKYVKPCRDLSPEWHIILVVHGKECDFGRYKEEFYNDLVEWWKYWKQN